jgi:hypothetical protein
MWDVQLAHFVTSRFEADVIFSSTVKGSNEHRLLSFAPL